jgi:hypothetical protein
VGAEVRPRSLGRTIERIMAVSAPIRYSKYFAGVILLAVGVGATAGVVVDFAVSPEAD